MMTRANRAQLVVAIQYLSLQHRSLLVAAGTRMSSNDRGYACAAESRLCDGAVDRDKSIVMDARITAQLASDKSPPASIRGSMSGANTKSDHVVSSRLSVWLQPSAIACFTLPTWRHVLVLVAGAILSPGPRTVAAALRVVGLDQEASFTNYHRVLNRNSWSSRRVAGPSAHSVGQQ